MTGAEPTPETGATEAQESGPAPRRPRLRLFALRGNIPTWLAIVFGLVCVLLIFMLWNSVTAGPAEERAVPITTLGSPSETFDTFKELWFDRALTRNAIVSVRRVFLGFLLAALVGVPLGILCGCFAPVNAFFAPLTIFGRNIPIAALIPLTFLFFGVAETQKVMFIFIACVMFIVGDTASAIRDVDQRYVDTAYTLGAKRRQIIMKVLAPLALPSVFNALRLLFGLAFGYIMLAEVVKFGDEAGGLGDIIEKSQRIGPRAHIWLVLILIPFLAILIDRGLYWVQKSLFPYRYGGSGLLHRAVRSVLNRWNDGKALLYRRFFGGRSEATAGGEL